jgi:hypothetical protein
MSKRYDVCAPRNYTKDGEEKTAWHRVGTAFENDKGIGLIFDSLPLPDKEGRVSVRLFEPREKQQGAAQAGAVQETASAGRRSMKDMANDDIPF